MADGVGKIALGQGLMAFGQNLSQAMDARERRRQSLEELRMRFQLNDIASQKDSERRRSDVEWERGLEPTPAEQASLEAERSRGAYYDARATAAMQPKASDAPEMFGLGDPGRYTPQSVAQAQRVLQETGDRAQAYAALEPISSDPNQMFDPKRLANQAMEDASDLIPLTDESGYAVENPVERFVESQPEVAKRAGIKPDMDPFSARKRLAEYQMQRYQGGETPAPERERGSTYDNAPGLMDGSIPLMGTLGAGNPPARQQREPQYSAREVQEAIIRARESGDEEGARELEQYLEENY